MDAKNREISRMEMGRLRPPGIYSPSIKPTNVPNKKSHLAVALYLNGAEGRIPFNEVNLLKSLHSEKSKLRKFYHNPQPIRNHLPRFAK